jgi:hypothetical protein
MEWLDEIGNEEFYEDEVVELSDEFEDEKIEWKKNRLGNITGSNFGKLVVKDKKGGYTLSTSATAENLIYKIAWERLLKTGNISNGLGRLEINSKETNHGSDWESHARKMYEQISGNIVVSDNKYYPFDEFIGGTPDGFVGEDGIIEIKCPYNGGNHLKTMLTGKIYNSEYEYQIQGYLWITRRKWCDFITYDPDLIEGLQLNIIRVERDENIIEGISMVMEMVKEKIKQILENEKLK